MTYDMTLYIVELKKNQMSKSSSSKRTTFSWFGNKSDKKKSQFSDNNGKVSVSEKSRRVSVRLPLQSRVKVFALFFNFYEFFISNVLLRNNYMKLKFNILKKLTLSENNYAHRKKKWHIL